MKKLIDYYTSQYDEDNRLEKSRTKNLEFRTTIDSIDQYVTDKSKIIDIGAGSGKYSFHYVSTGHSVAAIEIVPRHVKLIQKNGKKFLNRNLIVQLGDARKLTGIEDNSLDIVLCMGPFYHLRKLSDRMKCLSECKRIVRKKGIIAVAYINKHAAITTFLYYNINLNKQTIDKVLKEDFSFTTKTDKFLDISYFSEPDNVEKQINSAGLKVIDHIGVDGPFGLLKTQIDTLTRSEYELLYSYHLKTCKNKSILGYSAHGLIICHK